MKNLLKNINLVILTLVFALVSGCRLETIEENQVNQAVESRNSFEGVIITNISSWNCCISAKVRTNIAVNNQLPIHHVNIYVNNQLYDVVAHGGLYGASWKHDNHPTHPNYWELSWCYDQPLQPVQNQPVTICAEPLIVGNQISGPSLSVGNQVCADVTYCNPKKCGYELCWTDFAMLFDVVQGIVVDCGNGPTEINFNAGIPTSGGYQAIRAAIVAAAAAANQQQNLGWTFEYREISGRCYKGANPLPSIFIVNTSCKVLSLKGEKNNEVFYIPFVEDCIN